MERSLVSYRPLALPSQNQSFLTVTLRISRERQRTTSSSTCERAGDQCLLASPT